MYTIRCETGMDVLRGRTGCWVENRNGLVVFRGGYDDCQEWIAANREQGS
jgi:hypothetical protein